MEREDSRPCMLRSEACGRYSSVAPNICPRFCCGTKISSTLETPTPPRRATCPRPPEVGVLTGWAEATCASAGGPALALPLGLECGYVGWSSLLQAVRAIPWRWHRNDRENTWALMTPVYLL